MLFYTVPAICRNVTPQFGTAKDQLKQLESLIPANSYYKCVIRKDLCKYGNIQRRSQNPGVGPHINNCALCKHQYWDTLIEQSGQDAAVTVFREALAMYW